MLSPEKRFGIWFAFGMEVLKATQPSRCFGNVQMSLCTIHCNRIFFFFFRLNVNSYKWLRINRAFVASAGLINGVEAISSKIAPKQSAYNPHSMPIKQFIVGNLIFFFFFEKDGTVLSHKILK